MKVKKYLSMCMALIFTSAVIQISLFEPKKVYAAAQDFLHDKYNSSRQHQQI